jgi:beta-lactamase class A
VSASPRAGSPGARARLRRVRVLVAALAIACAVTAVARGDQRAAASAPAWRAGAASSPPSWRAGVAAADRYASARAGTIAFAVRTQRGVRGRDVDRAFPSASVVKAMLLVAYLRRHHARALTPRDRRLLTPMVRWSSNVAATAVRNRLGFGALNRFARSAGMTRFSEGTLWGNSLITARDQTRFFLRIDRLMPARHRAYGMGLLARVVPKQRWGIGAAVPPGWTAFFKGGWGSGRGLVDHQVALLTRGGERESIAVLTLVNPDHAYGKATLEGVFRRLAFPLSG